MEESAEIGIFGGTGIYDSGLLKEPKEITIDTPYGKPSDSITIGEFNGIWEYGKIGRASCRERV